MAGSKIDRNVAQVLRALGVLEQAVESIEPRLEAVCMAAGARQPGR